MEQNCKEEMDALIDAIGEWIIQDEMRPGLLNPIRLQQMRFSHSVLKKMVQEDGISISCECGEPYRSMGSITLEGPMLEFADCKWFSRAVEFASNVDVYPLTNGKVRMVLTFHGLVRPITGQSSL